MNNWGWGEGAGHCVLKMLQELPVGCLTTYDCIPGKGW